MIRFCTHFAPLSYRYSYDPLIDIDIDISQILPIDIDIDIFQNCLIDISKNCLIDIDIFKNDHIDIDIYIFQKCRYIDNQYLLTIYRTGPVLAQRPFSYCRAAVKRGCRPNHQYILHLLVRMVGKRREPRNPFLGKNAPKFEIH